MAFQNDFVSIPNRYKTARIQSNRNGGNWFVRLAPISSKDEALTVSGASFSAVKQEIIRRFGNAAVFSVSAATEVDPVATAKAARDAELDEREPGMMELNGMRVSEIDHAWELLTRAHGTRDAKGHRTLAPGQEITLEMCKAQGIRRKVYEAIAGQIEKQFAEAVKKEHNALAASVSRDEQLKVSFANFAAFTTSPKYPEWVTWFKSRPAFFSWPDNTWKNRDTLLKYCEARQWFVPNFEEIAYALTAIIQADGFFSQPTYKRSEKHLREAVRPITGQESADPSAQFSEQEVAAAATALRKSLPGGMVPNMETVRAVAARLGISDEMLEAIGQKNKGGSRTENVSVSKPEFQKTADELKADEQSRRNAARDGAPIPRMSIALKGYR